MLKRTLDIAASLVGVGTTLPLLVSIAVIVRLTSARRRVLPPGTRRSPFRPFYILKFRNDGPGRARERLDRNGGGGSRITRWGGFCGRRKLDELPQLFNVLKGDISLVGHAGGAAVSRNVSPGLRGDPSGAARITDLASLTYRDEAAILGRAAEPEKAYVQEILPEKIRLAKEYVHRQSFWFDLAIIFRTIFALVRDRFGSGGRGNAGSS